MTVEVMMMAMMMMKTRAKAEAKVGAINKESDGIFREVESNPSSNETNIPISQTYSLISGGYIWIFYIYLMCNCACLVSM